MFERYTEKARRTIFFARYEAAQFGSPYIEIPHLLLGLWREDFPIFQRVTNLDYAVLRQTIEGLCAVAPQRQPAAHATDIPLDFRCKRVLAVAAEEADGLSHRHIGTDHLLVAVLRENGPEARALRGLGIELDAAREAMQSVPEQSGVPEDYRETRRSLMGLLSRVPPERLTVAATLLAGLSAEYFEVAGSSPAGPFRYSFGDRPETG